MIAKRKRVTNTNPVTAVLVGDTHIRESTPESRTDNYWLAQESKLKFIRDLCLEHDCPLLHSGDVFDHWKPTPFLLAWTMSMLPPHTVFVCGQHDLPENTMQQYHRSGCKVLAKRDGITLASKQKLHITHMANIYGFSFGESLDGHEGVSKDFNVALVHKMVWHNNKPHPKVTTKDGADSTMNKLKDFNIIVTGDNHIPFVVEHDGRLLVNPGSMMRITASQVDHKPRVYLWYEETNTVEPVFLPIMDGVISRSHLDRAKSISQDSETVSAFVEKLMSDTETVHSFQHNIEQYFNKTRTRKSIKDEVMSIIAEAENE